MRRSTSNAAEPGAFRATAGRQVAPARSGWLAACAFAGVIGMAGTLPASAQWIGTAGGDSSATETAPAPMAPPAAPAATAPAETQSQGFSSGTMPQGGFSQGGFSQGGMVPGGMAPGGMMGMPAQPGPSAAVADCQTSVERLRNDLEKRGDAIQAATKKKRPPTELCPIFRNFVSSQQKFYDYLSANKAKCGVPDDVLPKMKENLTNVASVRNKVCDAAKAQASGGGGGPSGPPPQGAVSAGLGLPSGLPSAASARPGGVFDTLGGNALR